MENAAEALRMAGGVLIFVLALTISINAFSQARQSIDEIALYSDREYLSNYIDKSTTTHRIVGAESIVPTIYRAYKENFKIKFEFLEKSTDPINNFLYESNGEPVNYIDLAKENIADETMKEYIIKRILFGDAAIDENPNDLENLEKKLPSTIKNFNKDGLYNKIKNNTYEEYLGVYYQEETTGSTTKSSANKTLKKVVTYKNKSDS